MDIEEYRNTPGLNYSLAKELTRSPAHYLAALNAPEEEETPALRLGRLVHLATLQPKEYDRTIRVAPKVDRRFKEGKETWAAFQSSLQPGEEAITQQEGDQVMNISAPAADALQLIFSQNKGDVAFEQPCFATVNDVRIKGRPDVVVTRTDGTKLVVDLKTTNDASVKSFTKDIANYKYFLQAAWYTRLVGATDFVFVAVEKEPPYEYSIIRIDEESMRQANAVMDSVLALYSQCVTFKQFPGYAREVVTVQLPKWTFTGIE